MKQILFSVCLLVGFSSFASSQTAETNSEKIEISVCRPQITEAGRQLSFQISYRYRFITDENGSVKEVKEITDNKRFRSLMNDEGIIPCIKKWKLKSSERYFVAIFVGTTSAEEFLDISSKTIKVKILL